MCVGASAFELYVNAHLCILGVQNSYSLTTQVFKSLFGLYIHNVLKVKSIELRPIRAPELVVTYGKRPF